MIDKLTTYYEWRPQEKAKMCIKVMRERLINLQ